MHFTQPGGSFSSLESNGDGDSRGVDTTDEVAWTIDDDDDSNGKDWGIEDAIPQAIGVKSTFRSTSCKGLGLSRLVEESGSKIGGNS